MVGVLRLVLSPRWIAWHLLTLGAMVTCAFLAVWQWHRAGSAMGSALNVGYGLQWPLFALFFGFMWWRFLHMEVRAVRAVETVTGAAAESDRSAPDPAATAIGTDVVDTPAGESPAPAPVEASPVEDVPPPRSGRSPFGPRPDGVEPSRLSDPQLRAYNDELAKLTARDQET